ncbi:hypothetical protein [Rhodospirillum rubrum]|uniref:Transmembrane lipoprotein n=1 Tax=Rhodospirillum rubrum (strain ATCC 11170 / ATH 1.1.1 / DSM 467 / LMG 4362 / NCIMB 8255 / S1) TaxID=269796 RepID=Q2RRY1_RHORT|nr:hypothetical protein [Rhodospirillum rubrum]ABC23114.1 hypothetical protein Rru_A2314 [Rhodospirillum rubrum ATCC 11170]AEO48844.1 hypothetical protein F11_11900 [Rhodospirillum rubrum F11]MBK5954728.1 hypothetical protein [Rhodospirillum rubrum]QXG79098.1 hypothetical protein KUL73_11950 [Rhodospirillum rubrum]HAQ01339.1 hypothetical protein [Rhodospirillum rubrum]
MTSPKHPPIRRDWLSKILAGTLLGFTLALGCSGLLVLALPQLPLPVKAQLAMWVVMPLWLGVLSGCFAFRDGRRAWLWLGGATALVLDLLVVARLS